MNSILKYSLNENMLVKNKLVSLYLNFSSRKKLSYPRNPFI